MLTGVGVRVLLVFEIGHNANLPNGLLNESALAEARALPYNRTIESKLLYNDGLGCN